MYMVFETSGEKPITSQTFIFSARVWYQYFINKVTMINYVNEDSNKTEYLPWKQSSCPTFPPWRSVMRTREGSNTLTLYGLPLRGSPSYNIAICQVPGNINIHCRIHDVLMELLQQQHSWVQKQYWLLLYSLQ